MSGQDANSKDMLSRIHEQRVKDQNNDSTQTGAFPMVKAKKRISLDAKVTRTRLYSSILVTILCALLGFGYVIQINNTTSTYETMSEDELTKSSSARPMLRSKKLEQRRNELSSQLKMLRKTPRTKMRKPRKSPSRTRRPATPIRPSRGYGRRRGHPHFAGFQKQKIDSAILFTLLQELRNSGAEVIEINNVRVVTSTYISGTAGSLVCDGTKTQVPHSPFARSATATICRTRSIWPVASGRGSK